MKLKEVFEQARRDGFTHAGDIYSYRGRKIDNWGDDISSDNEDYSYETTRHLSTRLGHAVQNNEMPSNEYRFWRVATGKEGVACRPSG